MSSLGSQSEQERLLPEPQDEDPALLKARRSVKKMLPVLLIGVHWPPLCMRSASALLTVRQCFLSSLDRSVVAANYAIIATELGALNLAPWIATAYVHHLTW